MSVFCDYRAYSSCAEQGSAQLEPNINLSYMDLWKRTELEPTSGRLGLQTALFKELYYKYHFIRFFNPHWVGRSCSSREHWLNLHPTFFAEIEKIQVHKGIALTNLWDTLSTDASVSTWAQSLPTGRAIPSNCLNIIVEPWSILSDDLESDSLLEGFETRGSAGWA